MDDNGDGGDGDDADGDGDDGDYRKSYSSAPRPASCSSYSSPLIFIAPHHHHPSGRVGSSASRRWPHFWCQRQCLLARPRRARPRRARPRRARPRRQARRRALRRPRRGARRRALRQAGRRARPRTPNQGRTRMLTRSRTPTPTCLSQTVRLLRTVQVLLSRLPKTTAAPTAKASPSRPWLQQRRPPRA